MNCLPDEISYQILNHLGNPNDVNNLKLVCKSLNMKILDFQENSSNIFKRLKKYFTNYSNEFLTELKKREEVIKGSEIIHAFLKFQDPGANHLEIVFESRTVYSELDLLTGSYLDNEQDPLGTPISIANLLKKEKYLYVKSHTTDAKDSYCGTYKTIRYRSSKKMTVDIIITSHLPELFVQMCKSLSIFDIWFDGSFIYYTSQFYKATVNNVCIYNLNHLNNELLSDLERELKLAVNYPMSVLICSATAIRAFANLAQSKYKKNEK